MKILAIRLENLASLAGRHELDFTTAPLADQGLFAITGPTGAGKSTLLDALCLALYGSTPRLRQAPVRDSQIADVGRDTLTTADARTLLRRGCASGFAEVDFVGRDGRRYRARWSVRRARDKLDGSLQKVEQSLTDLDANQLLTAQKREFDRLLPERLGLNFDQFTRAVLLAQSEFAAFLKADDNARSELLERLTDTQHYSAISRAAFQRTRTARGALEAIEARLADALPAGTEARADLEREAASQQQALAALQTRREQLRGEGTELERQARLSADWQQAESALQAAEAAIAAAQEERHTLAQLDAIAPWRERAQQRRSLAETLARRGQQLAEARAALDRCDGERQALTPELEAASTARERAAAAQRDAQPELEQARQLESERDRLQQQCDQQRTEQAQLNAAAAESAQQQTQLQQRLATQAQQIEAQQQHLAALLETATTETAAADLRAALNRSRDGAQTRLDALDTLTQAWRERERLDHEQATLQQQLAESRERLTQLEQAGQQAKRDLTAAEQRQAQIGEQIESARAARSDEVARLRQQLREETPCPVCGAIDHPYRDAPPAHPGEALVASIEAQERQQLEQEAQRVAAAREQHQELSVEWRSCRQTLLAAEQRQQALVPARDAAASALADHPLSAELSDAEHPGEWLQSQRGQARDDRQEASERLQRLDTIERTLDPLERQRQSLTLALGKLETRQALDRTRLETLAAALPELEQALTRTHQALGAALGEHASAQAWQAALEAQRQQTQQRWEARQAQWQTLEQTHARLTQQIADLTQRQQEEQATHAELERAWQAWRRTQPELDEAWLETLLGYTETAHRQLRETCERRERERDAARVAVEERRRALIEQRRLLLPETPEARLLDTEHEDALSARHAAQRERLQALESEWQAQQRRRDTAQQQLAEDDRRRQVQQEGARQREAAAQELQRWERINGLIGSADGKRFRRIAQAYNLDHLLTHANQHLRALTPRYRLERGGSELGILVIDGDMADERRSVHSLSGGETFLVSLALALGLASMASHQLAIESLFIDEGFGSLDPASLALAMDALDGLQAQGRRVGVISHVQEMHERIPLQIRVEPKGNGSSEVRLQRN
ncbi:chromosome segregation protein SMC [Salinicola endophyticus]|uniref:Chromosome segregation protein SMC n=1 Tax=Salinicola endophyticus TaxID=1949083 RepID=A0ABY8FFR0_9GAMM|nr:AAA family ATPase [Salinicola endophyticus]WFF40041.1 chromosome segregation protein SMC [Salinicola endophyticus]